MTRERNIENVHVEENWEMDLYMGTWEIWL